MKELGRPTYLIALALAWVLVIGGLFSIGHAENMAKDWSDGRDWGWAGDVNILYGKVFLDEGDWEPVESQTRYGIELDFSNSSYPIGFVMGLDYAREEDSTNIGSLGADVESESFGVHLGLRKIWYRVPYLRPFASVGGTFLNVDVERQTADETTKDSDWGIGAWGELGTYVDVFGPFHLGLSVRYSWAGVELFGAQKNAGGPSAAAILGFHWED